jgi:hypothetical protein
VLSSLAKKRPPLFVIDAECPHIVFFNRDATMMPLFSELTLPEARLHKSANVTISRSGPNLITESQRRR